MSESTVAYVTEPADAPARLRPWHLDVWFDGDVYERIRDQSEREGCSLEEVVRRAVERTTAPAEGA